MWSVIFEVAMAFLSYEDIRYRQIDIRIPLVVSIIYVFAHQWQIKIALSLLPALVFALISMVSDEKVGLGDAYVIAMTGIVYGLYDCLLVIIVSLCMACVFGLFCLLTIKKSKADALNLPFIPFLFGGFNYYLICIKL